MMSMSPGALNSAMAERYFEEHYSQDDYYTQGQTCIGQWIGKGSAELGLVGDVNRDHFSALLQGNDPHNNHVLVPPHANGQHAAGWDSVYSAPKSVSIQALIGGDHRLIQAHEDAVRRTLQEVEKYATTHQGHDRDRVVSANVVGAAFNHLAARPVGNSDHGPDPQLHTHVVLLNVTKRPDGRWRGLDPIEIYRSQSYGSAIYRSELAREVQKLGYRIEVTASNGSWELEGYSREQVMAFSQRREDIQQQMAEAGLSGPRAAQIAALNSRQAKSQYDEAALRQKWKERAADLGIDTAAHLRLARSHRGGLDDHNKEAVPAVTFAARHSTEREAVVDRRQLEGAALQYAMSKVDLDGVRLAIKQAEQAYTLIRAGKPDWRQPQGAFTTDETLALERENVAIVKAGIEQAQPIADSAIVKQWAASKGLSPDQIGAAELSLTSKSWVTAIEGLAGTAKTTTVGAIREFAEAQGYSVHGFGMTSGSVKALKEAGLEAATVAGLIANKLPSKTGPELWIVDESSLLATRPVNELLNIAQEEGVERIVFVGDQRQHYAIEAGAPLRQFLAENMAVAELTTIRRQKDPALKAAVELAAKGRPAEALHKLRQQLRVHEIADVDHRYRRIAENFLLGRQGDQTTLVVSPGNDERKQLNQTIRELLVSNGHVDSNGQDHSILVAKDLTKAAMAYARNYAENDVVHFTKGNKRHAIARDTYLTIEGINRQANTLTLRTNDGGHMELSPARWNGVQVYQWEHRTLSAGDRIQFRIHYKANRIANGEFATITELKDGQATIRFDNQRELKLPLTQLRHIDHGYTSTSHSAQGATVDRVIVNVDSMRSHKLVNQQQFYVSISRARHDVQVFTDDLKTLERAVGREPKKSVAMEVIKPASPTTEIKPAQALNTTELKPQPTRSFSYRP
jgi:conjugative relaxase-like TrwC/TraI family protein